MTDVPDLLVRRLQDALGVADVHRDAAVARYTTWRVGGPAALLAVARDAEQLRNAAEVVRDAGLPWLVLGRGSNVLVCDEGVRGVVIVNRADALRIEGTTLWAESGALLSVLARRTTAAGLEGLEWCHDIPGSVGGAVVSNAGAHGSSMSDVLRRVRVLPPWGDAVDWDAAALDFGYRRSILREGQPSPPARDDWPLGPSRGPTVQRALPAAGEGSMDGQHAPPFPLHGTAPLLLEPGEGGLAATRQAGFDAGAHERADSDLPSPAHERAAPVSPSPAHGRGGWGVRVPVVLEAVCELRRADTTEVQARMAAHRERRKRTQPGGASAGSVFKNPPGDSAGRLIESLGLKGARHGDATISDVHANFIVGGPRATAADVVALVALARRRVRAAYGLSLEPEIQYVYPDGHVGPPSLENPEE